ncbi:MAG: recombinase family protein [Candidatus Aceula lacicola]|nr:recombinase family protein [Candidatus Aceula lacicola]
MKCACYLRVSTDEQAQEGYSLEVQEENLKKFAENSGWEVVKIYSDDKSGYSINRPALNQLFADAKLSKFDMVLVYKTDRFSRKLKDLLNLVDDLDSYNIAFKSVTEPFDTTTSSGKLMFQQLGSFAEFERNRIVERVLPGMRKSAEKGNWQGGKPPYGYQYNKEKKMLEIHKEEAKLVQRIYKMYLENKSITCIAGYFYEHGYKTRCGGKFYPSLVCDILKNKIYLGKIEWARYTFDEVERKKTGKRKVIKNDPANILIFEGKHEALISEEDYDFVQKKLAANRRGQLHRNRNAGYPLTGLLYCGKCNHRFRGASQLSSRKTKEKKRYYRCCGKVEHDIDCKNSSFKAEYIEPQIFAIIRMIVEHPKLQNARVEGLTRFNEYSNNTDLEVEAKNLKDKLRKNLKKQKQLWRSHSEGCMTYEVYKNESIDVRAEEQRINSDLAKLDMKTIEKERSEEYELRLKKVVSEFKRTCDKMDLMLTKEFLQLIFKRIVVKDRRIVELVVYEPFDTFLGEMNFKASSFFSEEQESHADRSDGRTV